MITDERLVSIAADRDLGHPKMWTNTTVQELIDVIVDLREEVGRPLFKTSTDQPQLPGVRWSDYYVEQGQ